MLTATPRLPALLALLAAAASSFALAQDRNIVLPVGELEAMLEEEPLRIVGAEISRPTVRGDITLKAEVAFGERPPLRVKLRNAVPGADSFNNVPRYDIAAYELQKLLMDAPEYVVPPTALRMVPRESLREFASNVRPTFNGADEVLCVVQYWLEDVVQRGDVLDAERLETDAVYARHAGQLNVLTYLIEHSDSNIGNFLVSAEPEGARFFAIDNGVAFASEPSGRGTLWKSMRVERLPADTVVRLRQLTEAELIERLGVLAQWEIREGHYVAVAPTGNLKPNVGVRRKAATIQLGLTRGEIAAVSVRAKRLLKMIDDGEIATF
jgi:hypothetical protein